MRIAIVGSDGKKWKEEQIPKVKEKINEIFATEAMKLAINSVDDGKFSTGILEPAIHYKDIILVSGHCPVGKERYWCYWCYELEYFVDNPNDYAGRDYQFSDKVYDRGGVDTFAEIIATQLGIKKEIYSVEVEQWNDKFDDGEDISGTMLERTTRFLKGYRSHNIQIAEAGLSERKWFCKECGTNTPFGTWNSLEEMLKGHPTLVGRPELHGIVDDYVLYDIEPAGSCSHCGGSGRIEIAELEDRTTENGHRYHYFRKQICRFCEGDGAYSGGTCALKWARKLGREVHKIII